jgi:hypothetical protein
MTPPAEEEMPLEPTRPEATPTPEPSYYECPEEDYQQAAGLEYTEGLEKFLDIHAEAGDRGAGAGVDGNHGDAARHHADL